VIELVLDLSVLAIVTATGQPAWIVSVWFAFVVIDVVRMRYSSRLNA
jgi:hypothetical protein